jgi:2-iminobutanoate/2-iminopropanoate deaminase
MKFIATSKGPKPAGHYSQAVVHNGVVYVSGQLGRNPADPNASAGPIEKQTEQTLENIRTILEAAGSGLDRVIQMTIFVSDIELWGKVNEVYTRMMGDHRPARAVVPVKELHYGYQIEIQAMAAVD